MIAAYGMYNWPEAVGAINPFWSALINNLKAVGFYIKGFSVLSDADYAGITQMADNAKMEGFDAMPTQEK